MQRFAIDTKTTRKFAPGVLKYLLVVAAVGLVLLAGTYAAAFAIHGSLGISLVDSVANPARYWILAIGIVFAVHLPYYVAVGVTRRSFISAGLTTMVLIAAVVAILFTILFYLEMLLYGSFGWTQTMEMRHLFSAADQSALIFGEHLVVYVLHGFAGWALAMAFYRSKAWGVAFIPLAALVVMGGDALAGIGWPGRVLREIGLALPSGGIWAIPALAAVAALVAWAVWRMTRDVAINPKAG